MSTFITRDGATLFYRDWGVGQPIVFSHGWPLSADAWDAQMMFFVMRGYRAIAHDRRGHGRSEQTSDHNDMDSYADDLAELFDQLDLQDAVLVGHSTGGGEVARYIGRHGTDRLAKVVLLSAVPPLMLQTAANPEGTPLAVFDQIRAGVLDDRSQYFREFSLPFYGFNRPNAKVSKGLCDALLVPVHAGRHQARVRLHRAVLRDRLHQRPAQLRRPHADRPRRRRPDRAHRRERTENRTARAQRGAEDLSGQSARPRADAAPGVQGRPAGVHRGLRRTARGAGCSGRRGPELHSTYTELGCAVEARAYVSRMLRGITSKRSQAPLLERARHVLRHAWRGDLPYEVQEVHDPPVVGRRVTDEHGSAPEQPPVDGGCFSPSQKRR